MAIRANSMVLVSGDTDAHAYIAETDRHRIVRVTIPTSPLQPDDTDACGLWCKPHVYDAPCQSGCFIVVEHVAGAVDFSAGLVDGTATNAHLTSPQQLTMNPDGQTILITGGGSLRLLMLADWSVTTVLSVDDLAVAGVGLLSHAFYLPPGNFVTSVDHANGQQTQTRQSLVYGVRSDSTLILRVDATESISPANKCASQCKPEYFRARFADACRACSTVTELKAVLDAQLGHGRDTFYRFTACNRAASDTLAVPCSSVSDGTPEADATDVGLSCTHSCDPGFEVTGQTCTACSERRDIYGAILPSGAGSFQSPGCSDFVCNADNKYFMRNGQCVLCNTVCATGEYLGDVEGSFVCGTCLDCEHYTLTEGVSGSRIFTSVGTLDDPASCTEQCATGYFAEFERCVPHSTFACDAEFYKKNGTYTTDTVCWPCYVCPNGMQTVTACAGDTDTVCSECAITNNFTTFTDGCAFECVEDAVLDANNVCQACASTCGLRAYRTRTDCACRDCVKPSENSDWSSAAGGCQWHCHAGYTLSAQDLCELEVVYDPPPISSVLQVQCPEMQYLNSAYQCSPCAELGVKTPSDAELGTTWRWKPFGMAICAFECIRNHYEYARVDGSKFCYTATEYQAHVLMLNSVVPASMIAGFAVKPVPSPDAEDVPIPPGVLIAICSIFVLILVFATLAL